MELRYQDIVMKMISQLELASMLRMVLDHINDAQIHHSFEFGSLAIKN